MRKTSWKKISFQLALNKTFDGPHPTPPVGVLNWVSTPPGYASTGYEHKFHKTEIQNWLPIGLNLALITAILCSTKLRMLIFLVQPLSNGKS